MLNVIRDEEGRVSRRLLIVTILGIVLAVFHMATVQILVQGYIQTSIHWMLVATAIILLKPSKFKGGAVWDCVLIAVVIFVSIEHMIIRKRLFTSFIYTPLDKAVSIIAIILALYIGYRILGKILPGICVLFLIYAFVGNKVPGMFRTANLSLTRISTTVLTDGLFGTTLSTVAKFLMLFIFFGALMDLSGSGEFFVDLVSSFAGRIRGGPAQAAIYSSMLMGMVNGSGPANVATTGVFTIPLMKKTGYKASFAGAVEAVASTGGQIMPPVMGAVAFLMSETTGIPYSEIAFAALVPAVLYYVALSVSVYTTARKYNMPKQDPASLPSFGKTFQGGWFYLIPMLIIIVMIFSGKSAQKSVFWAIVATFAIIILFKRDKLTADNLTTACFNSIKSCGPIAMACMLAGIIMSVINITGLGLNMATIITRISGGSLPVALVLTMIAAIILGMGLPTSAAYIVLSVLIAPALTKMGVTLMAAHLFVLYFGILSGITPPVALSTFTAAGIAGSGVWETGRDAIKLAAAGFIVPFVFVYSNELFLIGASGEVALAVVTAFIASVMLGCAVSGWCMRDLPVVIRIVLLPCAVMTMVPKPLWLNGVGMALAIVMIVINMFLHKDTGLKAAETAGN